MLKQLFSFWIGTFVFSLSILTILTILYLLPFINLDIYYDAALFIPEKLGLVAEVTLDDAVVLHGSQTNDVFLQKGRYRVYSDRAIALYAQISIISQDTSQVTEAISLYDENSRTPVDEIYPQYVFNLGAEGAYRVEANSVGGLPVSDSVTYWLKPYVGNQNAAVAIFSGLVQIGIIAFCLRLVYRYVKKDEIQELKASQTKKRGQWESFLDEMKSTNKRKGKHASTK